MIRTLILRMLEIASISTNPATTLYQGNSEKAIIVSFVSAVNVNEKVDHLASELLYHLTFHAIELVYQWHERKS